jgi:hypothetical protein
MSESHLCGLGYGPAVGLCEDGNEFSASKKIHGKNLMPTYLFRNTIICNYATFELYHSYDFLKTGRCDVVYLADVYRRFRETLCFHIRVMTEAAVSPETSDRIYHNA